MLCGKNPNISAFFQTRYHMYGQNVYKLSINLTSDENTEKTIFERQGNYGENWNYGQVTLNETVEFKVCKIVCDLCLYSFLWLYNCTVIGKKNIFSEGIQVTFSIFLIYLFNLLESLCSLFH
jgi:hypothetical protein